MKTSNIAAAVAVLMTIPLMFSCGKHKSRYVIGVSQCSEDVWREKLNDELRISAFSHDNVELKISSAYDDVSLQTKQIDKFVDMGVDLLVVAPGQVKASDAIERAYDKGIPVIVFDRRTHSNKYTAYIGADNEEMGRNMASYLSTAIHGEGNIVEICGLSSSSPAIDRRKGFDTEAGKHPGMKIVSRIESDWTEQEAFRQMDSLLSAPHPTFNYVFAHNDRMATGARRAAAKHRLDLKNIHFIGMDAMPQEGGGMQMVNDGELMASYIYPTRGDKVMQLAMDILEGRKYNRENLLSSALVTADNANVLLMQEEELERQSDNLLSLHKRIEKATNAFDTQRSYLLMLLLLVILLLTACAFIIKGYIAKAKINLRLKASMNKQQKMTEDMERMTQNQLRFFTNISHELRTPLTLISGPADQLAESQSIAGETRRLVEMIRRNVGILTQMVGEIMEFRKIQNDKANLTLNRFSIAGDLRTWAEDFLTVAERKHIRLATEINTGGNDTIIGDREKISHIYFNLMTNAIKYTPAKGCITTTLEYSGGKFTVSVSDTGNGISEEDCKHIFERFYQSKDAVGGTGIGLAIVKAYTELHRGEVSVESEKGKGCRFSFTLPESQPGYDAETDKPARQEKTPVFADDYTVKDVMAEQNLAAITGTEDYDSNRPLVLVIDDNAGMRAYLKSVLQKDYNVVEAQNGEEGMRVARKIVPQLVVSDVMMPVMDGIEFCRRLKDDVSTCHIPVILLTAKTLEEQRVEGYNTGADSYMTKPFTAATLTARIENLLKTRTRLKQVFSESLPESDANGGLGEKDKTFVTQLRKAIKSHIPDAEYSVEDLGAEMGLSRVQLYRKVKALTGYTVVDLLRKARLERAKRMLETTDKNVSEIAFEVGFTTPSYFAKRFKEEYGIKPGEVE